MRFRDLTLFNLSLLAKQGWRLLMNPGSLVAHIFKAKYYLYTSFLNAPCLPGMSYSWRSILAGREVLKMGIRSYIGDGSTISLWSDPWLLFPHSFKPFSFPMEGTEAWKVMDIIDIENKQWLSPVIDELFTKIDSDLIHRIPLSFRPTRNSFVWHYDKKGVFNVKSAYYIACVTHKRLNHASSSKNSSSGYKNLWNKVWKARVPPSVKSFVWRLLKGILPTGVALDRKVSLPYKSCIFCQDYDESDVHLFIHCTALGPFWYASFGTRPTQQSNLSLVDWICHVVFSSSNQQTNIFFMCLWAVWTERNNMIWNRGDFNPLYMATWTSKRLEEF